MFTKLVQSLNKKNTVWAALGAVALTIWNTPGAKEAIVAAITQPSVQTTGPAIGAVVSALLLYVTRPAKS